MKIFKILANLRIILRFLANFIKNSVLGLHILVRRCRKRRMRGLRSREGEITLTQTFFFCSAKGSEADQKENKSSPYGLSSHIPIVSGLLTEWNWVNASDASY